MWVFFFFYEKEVTYRPRIKMIVLRVKMSK